MKERSIILTADEVRGLADGRLRELRRPLKRQPPDGYRLCEMVLDPELSARFENGQDPFGMFTTRCPFGQPGDRLYGREKWAPHADEEKYFDAGVLWSASIYYAEDGALWQDYNALNGIGWYVPDSDPHVTRWRSPTTMPRWASRWTIENTAVRVERLQDISEESAKASGVRSVPLQEDERGCWWTKDVLAGPSLHGRSPRDAYAKAWDRAYGKTLSWVTNPWVWVIDIKLVEP